MIIILKTGLLFFYSAAFLTQTVCLDDTTVKFEIWDTAGQERYHSLAPMYYRGAQAAIIVYDITNQVCLRLGLLNEANKSITNFMFNWKFLLDNPQPKQLVCS